MNDNEADDSDDDDTSEEDDNNHKTNHNLSYISIYPYKNLKPPKLYIFVKSRYVQVSEL